MNTKAAIILGISFVLGCSIIALNRRWESCGSSVIRPFCAFDAWTGNAKLFNPLDKNLIFWKNNEIETHETKKLFFKLLPESESQPVK